MSMADDRAMTCPTCNCTYLSSSSLYTMEHVEDGERMIVCKPCWSRGIYSPRDWQRIVAKGGMRSTPENTPGGCKFYPGLKG